MAIDKIKKAAFLIPQDNFESFLIGLKNISSVEIISQKETEANLEQQFSGYTYQTVKSIIAKLEYLISVSTKYHILPPENIKHDTVYIRENLVQEFELLSKLYNEVDTTDKEIKSFYASIQQLEHKKLLLENFVGLNLSFKKLSQLRNYKPYFLELNIKKLNFFITKLQKLALVYYWVHSKQKNKCFIFALVHCEQENEFLEISKISDAHLYNLTQEVESDSIEEELENINNRIQNYLLLIETNTKKIKTLLEQNIEKIFDVYMQTKEIEDFITVQQNVTKTKYAKVLYCWVPEKFINRVKSLLDRFDEVNVLFFEYDKNEDIPTVLRNKPVFEPYEFVTTLYGYPKFTGIDPTGLLAPFFSLFFALCLSDIFYGVLLFLVWLFLRNKVPKKSEYYKLVILFKYLGIFSIITGVILDSFLGFSIVRDFKFPLNLAIFDPLNRPIDMLKFTFLLGFIQVIFGLTINAVKSYKDKNILSSIDSISWILFIATFAPAVYKLFFPKDLPQNLVSTSTKISFVLFLFIVIFQSRNIKNFILKPITVFVKAYNVIGFYADMLSYSRILALALATACIAQTVNLLVIQLFNAKLLGIKILEPVIAPIVFLVGHIFNFLIGCLGALVHSARLQYLEFFSKFFTAGGRPIKLFAPVK